MRTANLIISLAFGTWVNFSIHLRFPGFYITQTPGVFESLDQEFKIWVEHQTSSKILSYYKSLTDVPVEIVGINFWLRNMILARCVLKFVDQTRR